MPRILVAIALLCLLSAPSASNGLNWEEIDADAVVDRCWGISREDRDRGVTARMRAGTVDTIDCFAEKIARHAEVFFDPRSMTEAEVRQALEEIGAAYGKLY